MSNNKKVVWMFDGKEYRLSEKEKLFSMNYVRFQFNGTKAAIAAGYSEKTATVTASKLLTDTNIANYIDYLKGNLAAQLGAGALELVQELYKMATSDIREIFDDSGKLIDIKKFSDKAAANVKSVEVFEERDQEGNIIGTVRKVSTYDKNPAIKQLASMLGVDGIKKVSAVNPDGTPAAPPVPSNIVILNPKDLTDEQLEKLCGKS